MALATHKKAVKSTCPYYGVGCGFIAPGRLPGHSDTKFLHAGKLTRGKACLRHHRA